MSRGGRPELIPAKRRSERVVAYLTPGEFDVLKGHARAFGVSASELARRAITRVRIAAPVSAENVKRWRELGRLSSNVNQCARALNAISKRLNQLDDPEAFGLIEIDSVDGSKLLEMARENARLVDEVTEITTEIRALLMDQWEGNMEAAMSPIRVASNDGDET